MDNYKLKTVLFLVTPKSIEYLVIMQTNYVQDLYTENHRKDLNEWRDMPCQWIQ